MRENDGANMEGKYGRNIFVTKVIRSYRAVITERHYPFPLHHVRCIFWNGRPIGKFLAK